jgi:hypothetical protein
MLEKDVEWGDFAYHGQENDPHANWGVAAYPFLLRSTAQEGEDL